MANPRQRRQLLRYTVFYQLTRPILKDHLGRETPAYFHDSSNGSSGVLRRSYTCLLIILLHRVCVTVVGKRNTLSQTKWEKL